MIHIAIIDDDKDFCAELKDQAMKINSSFSADCFYDIKDFFAAACDYDIAIIDIILGKGSGIDIAAELTAFNPSVKIIFVSVEKDYFQEVYSTPHTYFLTKPVSGEQLERALSLSCKEIDKQNLYIKQKGETVAVDLNSVAYFEGALKRTTIHFKDGTEKIVNRSLTKIHKMLKSSDFIRIHQSYIIGLNSITCFTSKKVTILGRDIPISRSHMSEAGDTISRFIGNRLL